MTRQEALQMGLEPVTLTPELLASVYPSNHCKGCGIKLHPPMRIVEELFRVGNPTWCIRCAWKTKDETGNPLPI